MIWRHSLRAKFVLLALLNVAVLGVMLMLFVRHQLGQEFQSFLMAAAREKIVGVSRQLSLELAGADAAAREAIVRRYATTYGVEFRLHDADGSRLAGPETGMPAEVAARLVRPVGLPPRVEFGPGPPPFLIVSGEPVRYWIGVRTLLPAPDLQNAQRATLLLVSPTLWTNPFFFEWEPWLGIMLTAVVVTALCWLPLVRGLTRDIRKMTVATAAVAEGNFDVRLDTARGDELGRLGASINQMTRRLRDYVHGQKRFLGDVAHELRSPLGRMQVALGILERKTAEADAGYVRDLQDDVEILSGLTTELLTFARSELKREQVELRPVALRALVERAAAVEALHVEMQIDEGLTAMGEETLLFRAVSNLIRNAERHGGGEITVVAARQGEDVLLTVADGGPGVPEEALEQIFSPFFRLDSSREWKKGGTGLGLAIVRSYVEICGGRVVARNRPEGGLEMVVTLRGSGV